MRRYLALGLLMVMVLPAPATGQDSADATPEPSLEWQRVEVPVAGVAFSLPSGWQTDHFTGEFLLLRSTSPDGSVGCHLREVASVDFSLDAYEALATQFLDAQSDLEGEHSVTRLALPVGDSLVVAGDSEDDDGAKTFVVSIHIPTPQNYAVLSCTTPSSSKDSFESDVLAIAETLEFLPTEE